jgi:hypothetical protein
MDETMSHADDIDPRDLRICGASPIGHFGCGFADDLDALD